jgi:hypothetical protein
MIMKRTKNILAISLAMALPGLALAAAGDGLLTTAHDFSSASSGYLSTQNVVGKTGATANSSANVVGLCSYCHTPHSAQSTALLWNHKMSANTFTWDEATTSGGTTYATLTPTYKGASVKCLSCHDGSVAIGDVSLYKQRLNTGPAAVWNTHTVSGLAQIATSSGGMKGNHPVGMPYPFANAVNSYNSVSTGADVVLTEFVGDPTLSSTAKIKLYNQTGTTISGGPASGVTGMECSTCHDPHNKSATDDLFLRGKIAGSAIADGYICVQCHIK